MINLRTTTPEQRAALSADLSAAFRKANADIAIHFEGLRGAASHMAGTLEARMRPVMAAASKIGRPCPHSMITITHSVSDEVRCGDCGEPVEDPRGCQHHRIDNDTEQCEACGEKMIRPHREPFAVRSAPNKVACTIPDCDGGPGCENPDGIYVPDTSREREVVVRMDFTYECERCRYDGTQFTSGNELIWNCGHDHRGASVPVRDEVSA